MEQRFLQLPPVTVEAPTGPVVATKPDPYAVGPTNLDNQLAHFRVLRTEPSP